MMRVFKSLKFHVREISACKEMVSLAPIRNALVRGIMLGNIGICFWDAECKECAGKCNQKLLIALARE